MYYLRCIIILVQSQSVGGYNVNGNESVFKLLRDIANAWTSSQTLTVFRKWSFSTPTKDGLSLRDFFLLAGSKCRPTVSDGGNVSRSPARWAPTRGRGFWTRVCAACPSERYGMKSHRVPHFNTSDIDTLAYVTSIARTTRLELKTRRFMHTQNEDSISCHCTESRYTCNAMYSLHLTHP